MKETSEERKDCLVPVVVTLEFAVKKSCLLLSPASSSVSFTYWTPPAGTRVQDKNKALEASTQPEFTSVTDLPHPDLPVHHSVESSVLPVHCFITDIPVE
ncbi:hypothetical protein C0Q70_03924 [Pomacea canaliculata]|uniref:Uncharacterized protein n=1 Tax=Pomacea canaliculata TaxID=400727 RepID=A0A2T7PU26_POMCA|nr:hypothetical protein C0Q70_03924 [Pomacea canaliculata]